MQAAVLQIKLKHLDSYNAARKAAAAYYVEGLTDVKQLTTPYQAAYSDHVFHQFTLLVEDGENSAATRDGLNAFLAEFKIPSMIYYPVPGHKQKMFAAFGTEQQELPVTDWLTERVISLPIHTELEKEQQDFIIDKIKAYFNR